MENFNPCGIGQNIDYDYDHDNDSEGKTGQIVIVVVVVIAVDTHDIDITISRRATGTRPFWRKLLLEIQLSIPKLLTVMGLQCPTPQYRP